MSAKATKPATFPSRKRSILKGALAGLVGGIVGSGAKMFAEAVVPPHLPGQLRELRIAPGRAPEAVPQGKATEQEADVRPNRWIFGALAGAAYGALAEVHPGATNWRGVAFGLALNRIAKRTFVPETSFAAPAGPTPLQERASEWVTNAAYGVVTDTVRRRVRAGLG